MGNPETILKTDEVVIGADPRTGCVISFRLYGRELLDAEAPPCELLVNGTSLDLRATPHTWTNIAPYPQCVVGPAANEMHGCHFTGHYTGWGLDVTRALRAVRPGRIDLCWTVQRTKVRTLPECPGPGWGCIEAPLHIEALTVPAWNWKLWGGQTRMIALNTGSAGPANHVGYEHGPVEAVKRTIDTGLRRQYAGDLGLPGVAFHDAETGQWVALLCRRPAIAYQLDHRGAGQGSAFGFLPVGTWAMHQSASLPMVSLHYGRTQAEWDVFLAEQLSLFYEEPAEWFSRTTWCEFDGGIESHASWHRMHQAAILATEGGGVSGIFPLVHQRNTAWGGTSPDGLGPTHELGPRRDFEAMVRDLKTRGVRQMVWMSTCGMTPSGDADPDWFCRGVDGDFLPAWGVPHHPDIAAVNLLHPGYQAYVERWLEYYLGELGMDAVFFDCGGFAYPYDFKPRSFMRYPSDVLLGPIRFFDRIRAAVRRINPDAVVVTEGGCLDAFTNCPTLGSNAPSAADGLGQRDLVLGLRRHGGARFFTRAESEGDLGAGMVYVESNDTSPLPAGHAVPEGLEKFARIGRDPFNIALTRLVREQGVREAVNLPCGSGVSLLDNLLVVPRPRHHSVAPAALVPAEPCAAKAEGIRVVLPAASWGHSLENLVTGEQRAPAADGSHVFHERGIWRVSP